MRTFIQRLSHFEKQKDAWILIVLSCVFILLRLPSLIEPEWYGDEGIYRTVGLALSQGSLLYRDIWDNKPPLLYSIYSIVPTSLFFPKLLSLLFGLGAIIIFFFFSKRLFKSEISRYVSTAFFVVLFATPYIEGNIANAENFMLLPIITAFYLVTGKKSPTLGHYSLAGLFLGLAFLFKSVALFDFVALFLILCILYWKDEKETIFEMLKHHKSSFFALITGFVAPFLLASFYFLLHGAIQDFLTSAYVQNVGYVELENHFLIPQGLIILKTLGLVMTLGVLIAFRHKIDREAIIVYTWLAFSIYSAFFSHRPYMHYLLMLLPALSLLVGYTFSHRRVLLFNTGILLVTWYLVTTIFIPYKKNIAYYKNYVSYITGAKNIDSYQAFFDRSTPRDYKLASYIRSTTREEETIFLWGDSAQIYALSNKVPPGKYTVAYHISDFPDRLEETIRVIEKIKPVYIVVTSTEPQIIPVLDFYQQKYTIDNATIYERKL